MRRVEYLWDLTNISGVRQRGAIVINVFRCREIFRENKLLDLHYLRRLRLGSIAIFSR